jgi:hypothetical protein
MRTKFGLLVAAIACGTAMLAATSAEAKTTLEVCQHGCKYRTVQSAVNAVKKGKGTTIKIKGGTYKEGVRVVGHKYDGLKIVGNPNAPNSVVMNGKNAKVQVPGEGSQLAQNAIEGLNVDNLKMVGIWAKNYAANGFFIHADPGNHCNGYLMEKDIASFNRAYGLFAKHCIGGRITQSVGYGQGDSAIYIGETPPQDNPKWTSIDHDVMSENVLGYSGTNSKYVDIKQNAVYNNGAGLVPNTLDSELFQPNGTGKIRDNDIFWNNFNYFLPKSPVQTVSGGLGQVGGLTVQYPTGAGVVIFGGDGWQVTGNRIFGNFKWGAAAFSDPFNDKAVNNNNEFKDNTMGRDGTDLNGVDFFNDGSGKGNCFAGNDSTSFFVDPAATTPQDQLYPTCPAPGSAGTGTNQGDSAQVNSLASYVTSSPACSQQDSWSTHSHPKFKKFKPIDTVDMGECK